MGETGTPTGGAAPSSGATKRNIGSTSNSSMGSTSSGSTSAMSMDAGNAARDSTMASSTGGTRATRRMRADRN